VASRRSSSRLGLRTPRGYDDEEEALMEGWDGEETRPMLGCWHEDRGYDMTEEGRQKRGVASTTWLLVAVVKKA
jgi:hypothetical protein